MFKDRLENYKKIEEKRKSKLLVYITGDRPGFETQIHPEVSDYFINHLDKINKVNKITLFLYTRGGVTLAAWGLVNLIRQFCDDFEVIIPSKAHSSGTLIALGANTILMTKQATLGPIDPSINSPLNPQNPSMPNKPEARVRVSVESIRGYFDLAKEELKIKDKNNLANILISLSKKIHPVVLGDVYRSQSQIRMIGKKLLSQSQQITDKTQIEKIISFLCSESGSHDYTINRREAEDELGLNIEKPDEKFYNVIKETFLNIKNDLELMKPFNPNEMLGSNNAFNYTCRRALIESIDGGTDVFITEGTLTKKKQIIQQKPPLPPLERTVFDDHRSFEGWKYEKNT